MLSLSHERPGFDPQSVSICSPMLHKWFISGSACLHGWFCDLGCTHVISYLLSDISGDSSHRLLHFIDCK